MLRSRRKLTNIAAVCSVILYTSVVYPALSHIRIGVIEAAADHQLRVPQDLAVVGFDDIPAANLITPQSTTVHQPMAEKERSAVSMLLKENSHLRVKLPEKLVIRDSTAVQGVRKNSTK
jgi:DNA-binding LacI/PurR family transcriptional regulator